MIILRLDIDILRPDIDILRQEINILSSNINIFRPDIDILRSIFWPFKGKLMVFPYHILLSMVPPQWVMLWLCPDMNFSKHPIVAKLLEVSSPSNMSQSLTY